MTFCFVFSRRGSCVRCRRPGLPLNRNRTCTNMEKQSPQAGNPSDLWAFCLFSVLSASVFYPRAPVRCGWMLCRAWALQPASVHGCASSLALVRVPARSRGADRPWTPLRAPAVRVSASLPARAQAAFPAQAGGSELTPKQAVHPERTAAAGQCCCPPPASARAASSCRLFPCGAAPT